MQIVSIADSLHQMSSPVFWDFFFFFFFFFFKMCLLKFLLSMLSVLVEIDIS